MDRFGTRKIFKKGLLMGLIALLFSIVAFAQYWNSIANTPDVDNINTGNVGIGTPPTEKLAV